MALSPLSRPFSPAEDLLPLAMFSGFVGLLLLSAHLDPPVWHLLVASFLFVALVLPLIERGMAKRDMSLFLLLPTILSATQNVYLLFVSHDLDGQQIRFLIICNFIYSAIALSFYVLFADRADPQPTALAALIQRIQVLLVALATYGVATTVLFGADPVSALASLRNLTTPMIFTVLGLYAAQTTQLRLYAKYLVALAVAVVLFGFLELWIPGFWQGLHLQGLWEKKGIRVSPGTLLPPNFYSSEMINDQQLRRMAGSFADPVNLGTFLLAALAVTWYLKKPLAAFIIAVGCVLAISKGALLGVFVFVAVWARYRASASVQILVGAAIVAGSGYFYLFTLSSSTGSTAAHIDGFLAALRELPAHPLGRGMGNIGVLAGLFGEGASSDIAESGIGMILGQVGAPGLLIYSVFFVTLWKAAVRLGSIRDRILAVGLLGSFLLNGAFNEVAFSPNSAAPYFVLIGLVIGASMTPCSTIRMPLHT